MSADLLALDLLALHEQSAIKRRLLGRKGDVALDLSELDLVRASGLMAVMCRMAGYLGPTLQLHCLVDRPPHSLHAQSYAAKELETSVVAADGWGAAWYLPDDPEPCIYRSTMPIWGDVNRGDLGRTVASTLLLAAVRSATDPTSIAPLNTQPFSFKSLSFVHNGYVEGFRQVLRRRVCESLSDEIYANVAGDTDSEHLFALIANHWLGAPERAPAERLVLAVRQALGQLRKLARQYSVPALLTLLVSDGDYLVAARGAENARSPSLYLKHVEPSRQTWFASEPLDTEGSSWVPVADDTLWIAHRSGTLQSHALT